MENRVRLHRGTAKSKPEQSESDFGQDRCEREADQNRDGLEPNRSRARHGGYTTVMFRLVLAVAGVIGGLAIADSAAWTSAHSDTVRTAAGSHHVIRAPARDQARARFAFDLAYAALDEWLGPANAPAGSAPSEIVVRDRWRSVPTTMDVESDVVYQLARARWPEPRDATASAIVDGIAWYLQGRIVETLFDRTQLTNGYSMDRVSMFGGQWVAVFDWLPVSRWSAGIRRGAYACDSPLRARGATAFATLERYLTWPVLQGALRVWSTAEPRVTERDDVARILSAATGQDLQWFFAFAFDPGQTVNYAVQSVSAEPGGDCTEPGFYRSRVVVARRGTASFSGSNLESAGPYDSGEAVEIEVTFSDHRTVVARWDGRAAERSFDFDGMAPAIAASIDPRQTIVLDENLLDNTAHVDPKIEIPVSRWVARWLVWFQDAMLTSTL
jgi:hypothetical protein